MKDLNFKRKDYSKIESFERCGFTYTKVGENEEWIVWEMYDGDKGGRGWRYEIWKKRWHINPDGERVVRNIKDEEFGTSGFYLYYKPEICRQRILEYTGIQI